MLLFVVCCVGVKCVLRFVCCCCVMFVVGCRVWFVVCCLLNRRLCMLFVGVLFAERCWLLVVVCRLSFIVWRCLVC